MPTPAGPGTNQFRCDSCGRYLNDEEELTEHRRECAAVKHTGSGDTREIGDVGGRSDREWTSKP